MQRQHTTGRKQTPLTHPFVDLHALRAQLKRELLAEIKHDVAGVLLEVERAVRENARITRCHEYAAPRFINRRLSEARTRLLNILELDEPQPDAPPPGEEEATLEAFTALQCVA